MRREQKIKTFKTHLPLVNIKILLKDVPPGRFLELVLHQNLRLYQ